MGMTPAILITSLIVILCWIIVLVGTIQVRCQKSSGARWLTYFSIVSAVLIIWHTLRLIYVAPMQASIKWGTPEMILVFVCVYLFLRYIESWQGDSKGLKVGKFIALILIIFSLAIVPSCFLSNRPVLVGWIGLIAAILGGVVIGVGLFKHTLVIRKRPYPDK